MAKKLVRGISLYPGLGDCTQQENEALLTLAAAHGYTALFTSLQLPEADYESSRNDLRSLLSVARQKGMEVIADYSPAGSAGLGFTGDITEDVFLAARLGITVLRLDGGLSTDELKGLLSKTGSMRFCLNASTITDRDFISSLRGTGSFQDSPVIAVHNYYPRVNTGLDASFFCQQNRLWQEQGIPVGSFIPAAKCRGPVYAGLPTLEESRYMETGIAASRLLSLGADAVFFGDPQASEGELAELELAAAGGQSFPLTLEPDGGVPENFFAKSFALRPDRARDAVRAADSRSRLKEMGIRVKPQPARLRPAGAVTMDNELAGRYHGELQVTLRELPPDPTVNVLGVLDPETFERLTALRGVIDEIHFEVKQSGK